jgi:hypothetical protein
VKKVFFCFALLSGSLCSFGQGWVQQAVCDQRKVEEKRACSLGTKEQCAEAKATREKDCKEPPSREPATREPATREPATREPREPRESGRP